MGYKRAESLYQADRELCHQITVKHRRNHRTHGWREPGATRICDEETLRRFLEESLAQETPTSVRRIAAIAGYDNGGYIYRKFPDLCYAIARRLEEQKARQWNKIRLALETACAGGSPPTLHAISVRWGFRNSSALRSKFPEQCDELLACRRRHKEKVTGTLRDKLQPILSEEPAPSLSAVCRRFQLSSSSLYERCPELCRAISARHVQWQKARSRKRRQALETHCPVESCSLLYLNPPYDHELGPGRNQRMEQVFLSRTYRWLKPGGVLVLVIPAERLVECSGILASHFRDVRVYHLTEPVCVRYRQIALLAVRRNRRERERLQDSDSTRARLWYNGLARGAETLSALQSHPDVQYPVPEGGPVQLVYRGLPLDEIEDLLARSPAYRQAGRLLFALELKRSPRMTRLCSPEMTHPKRQTFV